MTALHFFAFSAAIRPGNAVFSAFADSPNVGASALAMSTSNPVIAPLVEVSSIGGNVGSVQYVNVPARPPAPAALTSASARAAVAAAATIVLRTGFLLRPTPRPGAYSDTARRASRSPPARTPAGRGALPRRRDGTSCRGSSAGRSTRPTYPCASRGGRAPAGRADGRARATPRA